MNKTFKYLFLLILISYMISELCCLSYNFKEGYSGFINKYELVSDPTKAGSIDIIDNRFDNQKQLTNLLSSRLLRYNQYLSDPYKYKHIGEKFRFDTEEKEKKTEEKEKKTEEKEQFKRNEYPKSRFKKVQSKYAPYQVMLPKQFQTENVQYVDQRKDAESNLNQKVKKDFKDQKGLEKPKERAIDGREFVSENNCVGKWSDWKTDNCGKDDDFCGIKTKVYKISKVEVDNEKGPGRPCPYKDGIIKYGYCKGVNNIERCGYEINLCNCRFNEDTVINVDGEKLYDLDETIDGSLEGKSQEDLLMINDFKTAIRDELDKPAEEQNMSKVDQDYKKLKTLMPNILNKKKCDISKDVECNCPPGYTFTKKDPKDICRLEPGVNCQIKYPGCVYTPPDSSGNGESCKQPSLPSASAERNFYKQYVREQGRCVKRQCICPNGTPVKSEDCPFNGTHKCKLEKCDSYYKMSWNPQKKINECKKDNLFGNCPFGERHNNLLEGTSTRGLRDEHILHCSSCTVGFKQLNDFNECNKFYDFGSGNDFPGMANPPSCCVPDQTKCNLKVINDRMELINPINDKCNDQGDSWTCGKAFKCKDGHSFKPSEKYKEDTELKFIGCEEGEEGEEGPIFNGMCINTKCNFPDTSRIYQIPKGNTECSSHNPNCGLPSIRCSKEMYNIQGVTPSVSCRAPSYVDFEYDNSNFYGQVTLTGCEERVMGEVTKKHVATDVRDLSLSVGEKVIITSESGDKYRGYIIGSSDNIGNFPKDNIKFIGEVSQSIINELDSLELDQLSNRAREEGVSPSEIEEADYNRQTIKDLTIQKIVEKETKETLERMKVTDRPETLERSLAESRSSNQEEADRINSERQEQTTTIMAGEDDYR
jgi:hypothetical protein